MAPCESGFGIRSRTIFGLSERGLDVSQFSRRRSTDFPLENREGSGGVDIAAHDHRERRRSLVGTQTHLCRDQLLQTRCRIFARSFSCSLLSSLSLADERAEFVW